MPGVQGAPRPSSELCEASPMISPPVLARWAALETEMAGALAVVLGHHRIGKVAGHGGAHARQWRHDYAMCKLQAAKGQGSEEVGGAHACFLVRMSRCVQTGWGRCQPRQYCKPERQRGSPRLDSLRGPGQSEDEPSLALSVTEQGEASGGHRDVLLAVQRAAHRWRVDAGVAVEELRLAVVAGIEGAEVTAAFPVKTRPPAVASTSPIRGWSVLTCLRMRPRAMPPGL